MTAAAIARYLIALVGGSFILFGIAYLAQPEAVLALTGSFQLDSNALTDSRATYGGIQLGLGMYLLLLLRRNDGIASALLLLGVALTTVGASRIAGYLIDGDVSIMHLVVGLQEMGIAAFAIALMRRLPE